MFFARPRDRELWNNWHAIFEDRPYTARIISIVHTGVARHVYVTFCLIFSQNYKTLTLGSNNLSGVFYRECRESIMSVLIYFASENLYHHLYAF